MFYFFRKMSTSEDIVEREETVGGNSEGEATDKTIGAENVMNEKEDYDHESPDKDQDLEGGSSISNDKDLNGNVDTDQLAREQLEQASEKSFASDTDSSALAEVVVKTVINKAVDVVKAGSKFEKIDDLDKDNDDLDIDDDLGKVETKENYAQEKQGDVKVGLFQYQGFGTGDNIDSESDVEIEEGDEKEQDEEEKIARDSQVGLFQYTEMEESEKSKSPVVSELDENDDETLESLNEDDKENIMKLYGLENVGPVTAVSPKSASPSENGEGQSIDKEQGMVIDVQRQVYEPQSRKFSITNEQSSSESTPRADENDGRQTSKASSENGEIVDLEQNEVDAEQRHIKQENETDDKDENKKKETEDFKPQTATSVSPPLIQYESVTENGKFRIIKTAKEGAGIRVGGDISPKDSPKQSPRDTTSSENEKDGDDLILSEGGRDNRNIRSPAITDTAVDGAEDKYQKDPADSEPETEKDSLLATNNEDSGSVELDRSKIRALLEKEGTGSELQGVSINVTEQTSKDKHLDTEQRVSPREMSVSDLKTSKKSERGIEVNFGNKSEYSTDYDWTNRSLESSLGSRDYSKPVSERDLYQPRSQSDIER